MVMRQVLTLITLLLIHKTRSKFNPTCWQNQTPGHFTTERDIRWALSLNLYQLNKFKRECKAYNHFKMANSCKILKCNIIDMSEEKSYSSKDFRRLYRGQGDKVLLLHKWRKTSTKEFGKETYHVKEIAYEVTGGCNLYKEWKGGKKRVCKNFGRKAKKLIKQSNLERNDV